MSDSAPIQHPSWLTSGDFTAADEPFRLFAAWLEQATTTEPRDPTAMTLATVDADGMPNARMVLLKGADERGFVFFTNLRSQKGQELDTRPKAALVFHWKSLRRQIRARGLVEVVAPEEADRYFATRSRNSQLGAHASRQSRPLASRAELMQAVEGVRTGIGDDNPVPRPKHWSGFRIVPTEMEFWHDRPFRLHDRLRFTRNGDGWEKTRLYP